MNTQLSNAQDNREYREAGLDGHPALTQDPQEIREWFEKICQQERGQLPMPVIQWKYRDRVFSTGTAWHKPERHKGADLTLRLGTSVVDAKLVCLHELGHYLRGTGDGHSRGFWWKVYELFLNYDLPMDFAAWRSGNYKQKAVSVAHELDLCQHTGKRCRVCGEQGPGLEDSQIVAYATFNTDLGKGVDIDRSLG